MHALPAHAVHTVLEYIAPLTVPLPPHLVSAPLRQRHRFLQLSPSSAIDYLCWPSPENARVADLLDRVPPASDQPGYSTRYTSDPESTFAHAHISSDPPGLRILFHWDDTHGWTYHGLQLMPFPSPSFSTPQESLASISARAQGPTQLPSRSLATESDQVHDDADDSYWDAYGTTGDDLTSPLPPRSVSELDLVGDEDAYWAQYASVQGTADSTVPSPLPIGRKLRPVSSNEHELAFSPPTIDVPVDVLHPRPMASTLGPPSPNMLAHLLSTISPREDTHSPLLEDRYSSQSPSAYSTGPSSELTTVDSELVTPPLSTGCLDASVVSPAAVNIDHAPLSNYYAHHFHETGDKALTDSIKGLYCLWKSGRRGVLDTKVDRNMFLQIVQAALQQE